MVLSALGKEESKTVGVMVGSSRVIRPRCLSRLYKGFGACQ